jgi:integrase
MKAGAPGEPSPPLPDLGLVLAPLLAGLEAGERPGFLARLERVASERYRGWAAEAPQHAAALLECARAEDEIAERAERLFPLSAAQTAKLDALLPRARELYAAIFVGRTLPEQFAVQAAAERLGGSAWRGIAAAVGLPHAMRDALATCSALEEANAARLEKMLASWAG